jgi:hypothetical protein
LEMNVIQANWMLSLTVPLRSNMSIGFGFDFNGTIDNALLVLSDPQNNIAQFNHKNSTNSKAFIIASAADSQTIFGSWSTPPIGPSYLTINMIVPTSYLKYQQFIYYAEVGSSNSTNGTHFHRQYTYSILNSPPIPCTNFLQPTRVEIYNKGVTRSLLIVYALLFVLCACLCRFRPLNTRGVSPCLTIFFLFTQLILETRNYAEISDVQSSLCLYYTFAMYPLQQIVFIMILLYFLR